MSPAGFIKTLITGIIQGITEWLPVSSTGHLILFNSFFPMDVSEEFFDLFSVVIQFGSILAVIVIYFDRLNPFSRTKSKAERRLTRSLWLKVAVASIPVAAVGFFVDDLIEEKLSGELAVYVTAAALVIYGVVFILLEELGKRNAKIFSSEEIGYPTVLGIGAFQALAVIPGTSRSGSTIIGAKLLGLSGSAAAEFSFFAAIPAMLGAGLLRTAKFFGSGMTMSGGEIATLVTGSAVAFGVSLVSVRFLTDFLKKHSFVPFGIYRIILGILIILRMTVFK